MMIIERWPLCGCLNEDGSDCQNTATRKDSCGVGFCETHADDSLCGETEPVDGPRDFDSWWRAAQIAAEDGDHRWDGLEYGERPEVVKP